MYVEEHIDLDELLAVHFCRRNADRSERYGIDLHWYMHRKSAPLSCLLDKEGSKKTSPSSLLPYLTNNRRHPLADELLHSPIVIRPSGSEANKYFHISYLICFIQAFWYRQAPPPGSRLFLFRPALRSRVRSVLQDPGQSSYHCDSR